MTLHEYVSNLHWNAEKFREFWVRCGRLEGETAYPLEQEPAEWKAALEKADRDEFDIDYREVGQ